jgi:isoleucyl-tRNA synthetase
MAEEIYLFVKNFAKGDFTESVNLENWPAVKNIADESVIEKMTQTRKVIELGLAQRNKTNLKVRQPLASISVNKDLVAGLYSDIIQDELNVKAVLGGDVATDMIELDTTITEELRVEGVVRDMIRDIQSQRKGLELVPSDTVSVIIKTMEDISAHLDMIKSAVNATEITIEHDDSNTAIVHKV